MYIQINLTQNPRSTAQEKGTSIQGGKIHHYTKSSVRQMRQIYKEAIIADLAKRGQLTRLHFTGPVMMSVTFYYHTAKKKDHLKFKQTKPDLDNMVKLLQDVLDELGFFEVGDQQVAVLYLKKKWTKDEPWIAINIDQISEVEDDEKPV